MKKPNGYVIFDGYSSYNGEPIIVIIGGFEDESKNTKTGAMLQTYILHKDVNPVEGLKNGADEAICGDCKHRPLLARQTGEAVCYVNVGYGVQSTYKAYKRGNYPKVEVKDIAHLIKGRKVRFGTYGDPCVVPVDIFTELKMHSSGHTGYTHRWRDEGFDYKAWAPLVMASVDNLEEQKLARDMGMRYFRVSIGMDELLDREVRCPASAEMGHKTTCMNCVLCSGTSIKAKDIVIADHGPGWKSRTKV
jgi:hypothetical protein